MFGLRWHLAVLGALTAASWVGTFAAPALASASSLLLVALSPRAAFVMVAAQREPWPLVAAIALCRMTLHAPVNYLLGSRYGQGATIWLASRSRIAGYVANGTLRLFSRFSYAAVLLRPNQTVLLLAGAARLNPALTAACTFTGASAYLAVLLSASLWTVPRLLQFLGL